MGKKCVQVVYLLSITLCKRLVCSHALLGWDCIVCTKRYRPQVSEQLFHNFVFNILAWCRVWLYTVSTKPTITTTCLYIKKPLTVR